MNLVPKDIKPINLKNVVKFTDSYKSKDKILRFVQYYLKVVVVVIFVVLVLLSLALSLTLSRSYMSCLGFRICVCVSNQNDSLWLSVCMSVCASLSSPCLFSLTLSLLSVSAVL
jgi:hypothetical protein